MKWRIKDPEEIADFSVDWSRFLNDQTISSVDWYIYDTDGTKTAVSPGDTVDGLTFLTSSNTSTVATARFSNGTVNNQYKITCSIIYGNSLRSERTIRLPVRET